MPRQKNNKSEITSGAADFSTLAGQLAAQTSSNENKSTFVRLRNKAKEVQKTAKDAITSNKKKVNEAGLSFHYTEDAYKSAHFITRFLFMDHNPYFQQIREIEDNTILDAFEKFGGLLNLRDQLNEKKSTYTEYRTLEFLDKGIEKLTDALHQKYPGENISDICDQSKRAYHRKAKIYITDVQYVFSYMNRFHAFQASFTGQDGVIYRGDAAKRQALRSLKMELDKVSNGHELIDFKDSLKNDEAYKVIQKSQGVSTLFLKSLFNVKTTSEKSFEKMLEEKEISISDLSATPRRTT